MDSDALAVGLIGVSGYTGADLARLVSVHPRLRLVLAASDRWAGAPLGRHLPLAGPAEGLVVASQDEGTARLAGLDAVFLCTPAEVSAALAPRALAAGARVVDLSGAFRLAAADYPRHYGFVHPAPELLGEARYSMPEATGSAGLAGARFVANPGCYPTASALALLPLLRAGIVEPVGLVADAKSGTTGAGKKGSEDMSFSEVDEDLRAYRVARHQHAPEIERALDLAGAPGCRVTFTPHLLPVRRGILATVYGRLRPGRGAADAAAAVRDFVVGHPFLRAVAPEEVTLRRVVGSNRVLLAATADEERGMAIGLASIDNLLKGAAGQAVQNLNLMLGWPETEGLLGLAGWA